MNLENRVSVVIPAYNSAVSVRRSIDSALAQDPPPWEVITINDGSTDDTADVLKSYGADVRYLQQQNQGQGAARNAGLRVASGDFVAFLDADDYWQPGFLKACLSFLNEHPQAVAVSTGSIVKKFGKPDRLIPALLEQHGQQQAPRLLESFFDFWASHDHVRTGSVLIRRSVISDAGFQRADLRISQDLEYWGYIATFGTWGFIPQALFVTDGTPSAAAQGWLEKYQRRRKLCPTVEQWQSRIAPRLTDDQWPGFRQVRARVAASFAHAKVLGGDAEGALAIIREYGAELPPSWSSRMMKRAARGGTLGWQLGCRAIKLREAAKSAMIQFSAKRRPRSAGATTTSQT